MLERAQQKVENPNRGGEWPSNNQPNNDNN